MSKLIGSLGALPCFTHITRVSAITGGLSNPCFKVEADGLLYFAKKTATPLFNTELSLTKLSAELKISPTIFYHDDLWIISPFIVGCNLAQSQISQTEKLELSVALMADFHQLTFHPLTTKPQTLLQAEPQILPQEILQVRPKTRLSAIEIESLIPELNIVDTVNDLLISSIETNIHNDIVMIASQLEQVILPKIKTSKATFVCCHSDVNFSNVLIDNNQKSWLIDFEYACYAPIEFDIAMLIAVNNIPLSSLRKVIALYENKTNILINESLCRYFLVFSYLINGLWYYSKYCNEKKDITSGLLDLAQQQWKLHDKLTLELALPTASITLSTVT